MLLLYVYCTVRVVDYYETLSNTSPWQVFMKMPLILNLFLLFPHRPNVKVTAVMPVALTTQPALTEQRARALSPATGSCGATDAKQKVQEIGKY